ncbi:uncharacterized protein [Lolium perenne]|uniref:uncharacterized protein n=1 Tax=Lolium perenne TaxID=4522 RepID=UPI0021F57FAB|nr:uncharacterized protein LOC127303327 [Lolium perenne]
MPAKEDDTAKLVYSQPASGIVKVTAGKKLLEPVPEDRKDMTLNCLEVKLDVDIPNSGRVAVLNTVNLPLVKEVGLGADSVSRLGSPTTQVTYIVRGSGPDGKHVLETHIDGGSDAVMINGASKLGQTLDPIFSHLAGKTSVWKTILPEVLEASFSTTQEMDKLFRSKMLDSEIF